MVYHPKIALGARRRSAFSWPNAMQPPPSAFRAKALGGENHSGAAGSSIPKSTPLIHPAIAGLQSAGDLADNCQHRPVQYRKGQFGLPDRFDTESFQHRRTPDGSEIVRPRIGLEFNLQLSLRGYWLILV